MSEGLFAISSSRTGAETITKQKQKIRPVYNTSTAGEKTLDLSTDEVLYVIPTTGDIDITIPNATSLPNDGYFHIYWIKNGSSDYKVNIMLSGNNTFSGGNTKVVLENKSSFIQLGGAYFADGVNGWVAGTKQLVRAQSRLSTTWSGANFQSTTAVPFDTLDTESNNEIVGSGIGKISSITGTGTTATVTTSEKHPFSTSDSVIIANCTVSGYNGTHTVTVTGDYTFTFSSSETSTASDGDLTPSRIYARVKGTYHVGYWGSVTAGSSTYNVTATLRKNGSTTIAGSSTATGNYNGENQSFSLGPIYLDLDAGDYVELTLLTSTSSGDPSVSNVTVSMSIIE